MSGHDLITSGLTCQRLTTLPLVWPLWPVWNSDLIAYASMAKSQHVTLSSSQISPFAFMYDVNFHSTIILYFLFLILYFKKKHGSQYYRDISLYHIYRDIIVISICFSQHFSDFHRPPSSCTSRNKCLLLN